MDADERNVGRGYELNLVAREVGSRFEAYNAARAAMGTARRCIADAYAERGRGQRWRERHTDNLWAAVTWFNIAMQYRAQARALPKGS